MVVSQGHVLDQYLTYNTDPWLSECFIDGKNVKAVDNFVTKGTVALPAFSCQRGNTAVPELSMKGIGRTRLALIGTNPIEATQKQIPVDDGFASTENQLRREAKSLVLFHPIGVERNNRDMRKAGFIQRTADETDIIARTTAATGLGHDDGKLIGVIVT